ncbi:hypothetical protein TNCV_1056981 [Trichonephila clavipes]|nr:hypothetical protein TNCV_1056981 [Trichonephila clavipes]
MMIPSIEPSGFSFFLIMPSLKQLKYNTINIKKPHYLRSELIVISGALDHALNSYKDSIWIRTDSRSCIQYLKLWTVLVYIFYPNWLGMVRGNIRVSSGYHRMWVCLGTKQLMSWLVITQLIPTDEELPNVFKQIRCDGDVQQRSVSRIPLPVATGSPLQAISRDHGEEEIHQIEVREA